MLQIEMFRGFSADEIKDQINTWLQEHPNTIIHHVKQSESRAGTVWNITVSILYLKDCVSDNRL